MLSRVDVRAAEGALRHLVGPIARRLGVLLGESSTGTNKDIIDDLRRLTAILGNAAPAVVPPQTHPTVLIMREMWPLFEQVAHSSIAGGYLPPDPNACLPDLRGL